MLTSELAAEHNQFWLPTWQEFPFPESHQYPWCLSPSDLHWTLLSLWKHWLWGQKVWDLNCPPGEDTNMHFFNVLVRIPWCSTKDCEIKECIAPVSKSTIAGYELARSIPRMTGLSSRMLSTDTRWTLPWRYSFGLFSDCSCFVRSLHSGITCFWAWSFWSSCLEQFLEIRWVSSPLVCGIGERSWTGATGDRRFCGQLLA